MIGPGVHERSYIAREAKAARPGADPQPGDPGSLANELDAGDLRRSPDRGSWPVSWRYNHPLLARALEHGITEDTTVTRLVDHRMDAGCDEYHWHAVRTRTWLPTDELESIGGRPVGKMRYGPPGKSSASTDAERTVTPESCLMASSGRWLR
jgi:hypothetical protein